LLTVERDAELLDKPNTRGNEEADVLQAVANSRFRGSKNLLW
jgi:hypothetical protein